MEWSSSEQSVAASRYSFSQLLVLKLTAKRNFEQKSSSHVAEIAKIMRCLEISEISLPRPIESGLSVPKKVMLALQK